jgi:hypothetical protein
LGKFSILAVLGGHGRVLTVLMLTSVTAGPVLCVIGCGTAAAPFDGSIGLAAAKVTLPVPRAATEGRSTAVQLDSTPVRQEDRFMIRVKAAHKWGA